MIKKLIANDPNNYIPAHARPLVACRPTPCAAGRLKM